MINDRSCFIAKILEYLTNLNNKFELTKYLLQFCIVKLEYVHKEYSITVPKASLNKNLCFVNKKKN